MIGFVEWSDNEENQSWKTTCTLQSQAEQSSVEEDNNDSPAAIVQDNRRPANNKSKDGL